MINNSTYTNIISAKNGTLIPVYSNGKTVDSKYNPEREADNIINDLKENFSFFIVLGIGSGILISKLLEKFTGCKIIAVENDIINISFLTQIPLVNTLSKNKNVIFSDLTDLENNLIKNYIPALHGNLKIIEQRGWVDENKNLIKNINQLLSHGLGIISADFSVQSHFGKVWQSNIMSNLKLLNEVNTTNYKINTNKIAIIVAAGPSLDQNINMIKQNRDDFYIITTDTAYAILIKNKITPDMAITIDGQFISKNHFSNILNNDTLFLLDLCSNNTIGNLLFKKKSNFLFFVSGHPLSDYANSFANNMFPSLFSGAGTVTITALDAAINIGFKKIKIIGADFSYFNGKSYGKGSYFDTLYGTTQNKITTIENNYNSLMFRNELSKIQENKYTTKLLQAYKQSFESYINQNNCTFNFCNSIYNVENNNKIQNCNLTLNKFNYQLFLNYIKEHNNDDLTIPLLPFIAWLRNNKKYKNFEFNSLLKLAQSHIVSYN